MAILYQTYKRLTNNLRSKDLSHRDLQSVPKETSHSKYIH